MRKVQGASCDSQGRQICAMLGPSPAQKGKSNAILVELNSSFSAAHRKIQLDRHKLIMLQLKKHPIPSRSRKVAAKGFILENYLVLFDVLCNYFHYIPHANHAFILIQPDHAPSKVTAMRARTGSGDREHHATGNHGIKAAGRMVSTTRQS